MFSLPDFRSSRSRASAAGIDLTGVEPGHCALIVVARKIRIAAKPCLKIRLEAVPCVRFPLPRTSGMRHLASLRINPARGLPGMLSAGRKGITAVDFPWIVSSAFGTPDLVVEKIRLGR